MKLNAILILGIFVIVLLVAPVQAISSYIEDYRMDYSTDTMIVDMYNPSSDKENLVIDLYIHYICVFHSGTEEYSYHDHSECFELEPGEHRVIRLRTDVSRHIPDFCTVLPSGHKCTLEKCPLCFIATAAYGTPTAKEINILREFRDEVLMENSLGKELVDFYYAVSPPLANIISEHELLRTFVREIIIDPIVMIINETKDYWRE